MNTCDYKAEVFRGNHDKHGRSIITVCFCVAEENHEGCHLLQVEPLDAKQNQEAVKDE